MSQVAWPRNSCTYSWSSTYCMSTVAWPRRSCTYIQSSTYVPSTTSQTFYFRFSINNTLISGTLRYKIYTPSSLEGKLRRISVMLKKTSDHRGREVGLFVRLAPPPAVTSAERPAPASTATGRTACGRAARAVASRRLVGVPSRNSSRTAGNPALPGLAQIRSRPLGRVPAVESGGIDVFNIIF